MASIHTKDTQKCHKCGTWKHVDDFPKKRRTCYECRKQDHYAYRAKRNPAYKRCPTVPVTKGLAKALEIAMEPYDGSVTRTCAALQISRSTYYRVARGTAYTDSGLRVQVQVAAAEKILRAAQGVIADRSIRREQWVSISQL